VTQKTLGKGIHYGAFVALAGAAIVAGRHPLIIALLAVGAGAFFLGRKLEKSV
jgi:hypothetical protein